MDKDSASIKTVKCYRTNAVVFGVQTFFISHFSVVIKWPKSVCSWAQGLPVIKKTSERL